MREDFGVLLTARTTVLGVLESFYLRLWKNTSSDFIRFSKILCYLSQLNIVLCNCRSGLRGERAGPLLLGEELSPQAMQQD